VVESAVTHVDAIGNTLSGTAVQGGALSLGLGSPVLVHSSNVSLNTVIADTVVGAAVATVDEASATWRHNNVFANAGGAAFAGFVPEPSGLDGNLVESPVHTDITSADPTQWDLTLTNPSALIDAGDPKETDPDGSPSDIGAYGGPFGDGW
ncbi:MAG: hypothetical protein AAF602_07860, partial [Myxococcota bacterium]